MAKPQPDVSGVSPYHRISHLLLLAVTQETEPLRQMRMIGEELDNGVML